MGEITLPRKNTNEPKLTLERILHEAYGLFASEGYEGTTLSTLSKRLGVSKPALYYYFDSKEALFEALYQAVASSIKADLDQQLVLAQDAFKQHATKACFIEIIHQLGRNDFDGLQADPKLAKVLRQFDLLSLRQQSIQLIASELEQHTKTIHHHIFQLATDAGLYTKVEAGYLQAIISALINGFNYALIFENREINDGAWDMALARIL